MAYNSTRTRLTSVETPGRSPVTKPIGEETNHSASLTISLSNFIGTVQYLVFCSGK